MVLQRLTGYWPQFTWLARACHACIFDPLYARKVLRLRPAVYTGALYRSGSIHMQRVLDFFAQMAEFLGNHYLLALAFLVVMTLLVITEGRKGGKTVSTQQATALINRENAVVVDVRSKKDYAAGHIVDSVNIPSEALTKRMSELDKHKDKALLLVCGNGQHSGPCAKVLKAAGHTNVNRLAGGIAGWRADSLPLVK
jgi:rhodanese-related sulfurtransferase|tara:strand:+ start:12257 stop:12847 length:591 start_codon:yes stop_codon:yes gene_type:complete